MDAIDVLSEFLASRFPEWGCCDLVYEPEFGRLCVYCRSLEQRQCLIAAQDEIQQLNVGVRWLVAIYPGEPQFGIRCGSSRGPLLKVPLVVP